ncbi:MAG: pirin family protein [Gammaproteobacteria bacterium]
MSMRTVQHIVTGHPTSDGAGVKLTRILSPGNKLDPFLLLDEFNSDEAADYIGGFPSHPHRGFETVTYMLDGEMLHEDHLGNQGRLTSGSVQWMTAARGIIHSEMPQQIEGRMRGFQLWLNLPASEKMKDASYRDIPPEDIPRVSIPGGWVKVVAGKLQLGTDTINGVVQGVSTDPLYLDVQLEPGATLSIPVSPGHTAAAYVFEGAALIGGQQLVRGQMAVLDDGDSINLAATDTTARILLLAAKPLREPVAHYGPFVMNTTQEIEQAMRDYRDGRLTV